MKRYFLLYGDFDEWFTCEADSPNHAAEQCDDFTQGEQIHDVFVGEQVSPDKWYDTKEASTP